MGLPILSQSDMDLSKRLIDLRVLDDHFVRTGQMVDGRFISAIRC
jgi:hypothetical protein